MPSHDGRKKGGKVAERTIEQRLSDLEQQQEINRTNINLIIDFLNGLSEMILAALGQMKKIKRLQVYRGRGNQGDTEN